MLVKKPVKVVAVALVARMALTVWAFVMIIELMASHRSLDRGNSYRAMPG
ncbi:hypothetical protein LX81_04137 [Palleronia aestuarii]|uniref:Uncharacterized protein n=1 Tax=Palleronia aestuarii TaxID=568105 RepID=A0A2W7MTI2_9RHOB|nr:hypothetical protein [Palleronia aestuarii]PZX10853.1 hypothetical protein LX81_04137 [Palleronia aestuarii]